MSCPRLKDQLCNCLVKHLRGKGPRLRSPSEMGDPLLFGNTETDVTLNKDIVIMLIFFNQ
jgi:hypothetical protein